MAQRTKLFLINYGPLLTTIIIFFVGYFAAGQVYPTMQKPQVFFNLFINNAYLLLLSVGMTFVIISGGIDLSVAGVAALSGTGCAVLLQYGLNPILVIIIMLMVGIALGLTQGCIIHFLKVEPFVVTLAGMFFSRGVAFIMSLESVTIKDDVFRYIGLTPINVPFVSNAYVYIYSIVAVGIFLVAAYVLNYTRFGRTVYALGNNVQSVKLMGLPVGRTKLLIYSISGFCSALGGIVFSIALTSGYAMYLNGNEMDAIASCVMGGIMLTGGVGNIFGTMFGVLIEGLIISVLQFNGTLSSWWTRIGVGVLTLVFIGIQSLFYLRKTRQITAGKSHETGDETTSEKGEKTRVVKRRNASQRNRNIWLFGGGAVIVIAAIMMVVSYNSGSNQTTTNQAGTVEAKVESTPKNQHCTLKDMRPTEADALKEDGAIIVMNRNGGDTCVDILYAVYPDGKIVIDDGSTIKNKQANAEKLEKLLASIKKFGWFDDEEFYDTKHIPCGQCYSYDVTVTYEDVTKKVHAVDGGTDAPGDYWQVVGLIDGLINKAEEK